MGTGSGQPNKDAELLRTAGRCLSHSFTKLSAVARPGVARCASTIFKISRVDGFGFNAVEDHVGELLDDCSPRVFRNELKCFWTAPDGPQALFHALKKHVAQARLLLLVPLVGLLDITFRRWQQDGRFTLCHRESLA